MSMLFKTRDKVNGPYDVIVVGGGLAGLTAANTLGRNGHKVLLLESHNKLGGFATWFNRQGGHIFDVSLHGFPVGMIKTCRKYWSKEIADSIVQLKHVRFINPQFTLSTTFTREDFTKILVEKFSAEKSRVEEFFKFVFSMNFYDDQRMTTRELFEQFFPGRTDIFRLLMEPITYANGSTLDDPAITYGTVFSNFMSKGVYTFQGGTDQLISKMKDELLKNGVDIQLQAKVEKIAVEPALANAGNTNTSKPQVKGVMLKGNFIEAKAVLSNANLLSTIFHLVGEEHFSPEFLQEGRQVRLNSSSCQVYMGLREGEKIDDLGELIFTSTAPEFNTELLLSMKITSRTFSIYYPESRPGHTRYAIVSSTNARYEDWAGLSSDDYVKAKEEMIEDTLRELQKLIPDIRDKIDFIQAATPLTVEKYTLHKQGSSFGTKFEGLKVGQGLPKEVQGLFHSGSVGIIMSGWLGAANYGVIVSNEVESYLIASQ